MSDDVVRKFTNPAIEYLPDQDGYWIDDEPFLDDEWEMKVILTRVVKPFKDGTLIRKNNTTYPGDPGYIFQKIKGKWYTTKVDSPRESWSESGIRDQYMKEHPTEYVVLYEPNN